MNDRTISGDVRMVVLNCHLSTHEIIENAIGVKASFRDSAKLGSLRSRAKVAVDGMKNKTHTPATKHRCVVDV